MAVGHDHHELIGRVGAHLVDVRFGPVQQHADGVVQRRHAAGSESAGDRTDPREGLGIDQHVLGILAVELNQRHEGLPCLVALFGDELIEALHHVLGDRSHGSGAIQQEPDVRPRGVGVWSLRQQRLQFRDPGKQLVDVGVGLIRHGVPLGSNIGHSDHNRYLSF